MPSRGLLGVAGRKRHGVQMPDIPTHTSRLYVAKNGNDANPGTAALPLLTIEAAVPLVTPGTLVVVRPGTYTPSIRIKSTVAGTSTNRIIWMSEVKWAAKIVSGATDLAWWNTANYNDFIGFDITVPSTSASEGIQIDASNCGVYACFVHDIYTTGTCLSSGGAGINCKDGTTGNIVIGNKVGNIGPTTCSFVHGIYISGEAQVKNNVVYNISGYGIHMWHLANNDKVSHNTMFQCKTGGIVVGADSAQSGNNDFTDVCNNIVYDSPVVFQPIRETGVTGPNNRYMSNLLNSNALNGYQLQNGLTAPDGLTSAPGFVNYQANGSGNYRLTPSSSAKDQGTTVIMPSYDGDWEARPINTWPDLGAYENQG